MLKLKHIHLVLILIVFLFGTAVATESTIPEALNGRGESDVGRSEPQYVGYTGYLAYYGFISADDAHLLNTPWQIPVYTQDKQFWTESGSVEHKTEVCVLSQDLTHEGYGRYSGMLLVERIDNQEQLYVNVRNFITKPYWTYADLRDASLVGNYLAEYHSRSDYYPVNKSNEPVSLQDGSVVLVVGPTGTYGRKGPNKETHPIEALVFQQWKSGYGGVHVFFSAEDLQIVY